MITIKFSSYYPKLPPHFENSRLIQVLPIDLSDISDEFREYDTTMENGEHYALPKKGTYIILFLTPVENPFCLYTTIRRARSIFGEDRYEYYKSHVCEEVKCVVGK